ncbi:hypothetical protein [Oscillibacter sp.]|uniref:hypothetical protein n=1 Tax=Oscillibacter sp. TaxID=1945593 RepID=UPI003398AABD
MAFEFEQFKHWKRPHYWGRVLPLALAVGTMITLSACGTKPPNGSADGSVQPTVSQPASQSSTIEIANTWAEAVKNRDGKAQYDLMTSALQKSVHDQFSGLNWVTGTSSPWVERYSTQETDAGARVTLEYASSAGSAGSYQQDLTFEEVDGALKISGLSDPVEADTLSFETLSGLLGMKRDELIAAMGDETPVDVDEGGLGFEKAGIRVWFDNATYTKVAQVFIMTDAIDLNGVHMGDSLDSFKKVFGDPISDSNGDARFPYKDFFLSVIHDVGSKSDKTVGIYLLQENL